MSALKKSEAQVGATDIQNEGTTRRPSEQIADRRSKELVIAFAGPIGCGINPVKDKFTEILSTSGYIVYPIKISEYLETCIRNGLAKIPPQAINDKASRYIAMQDAGNAMREVQGDFLAEYAIKKIAEIRRQNTEDEKDVTDVLPQRTAYLIDQLKHQDEVSLLRAVYGNLFYLFGVLSTTARRISRLKAEPVDESRISELISRDRRQIQKNGQQLDKTLQLADFFIRNESANAVDVENQVKRSIDLIHGVNGITPTREEYGMYAAYASGLRSACLSRQVGAAIMDPNGRIISTGRNDVPRPGGGLYGPENSLGDARCVKLEDGQCANDREKIQLSKQIQRVVEDELSSTFEGVMASATSSAEKDVLSKINIAETAAKILQSANEKTRLGSLIEFSRSIHAEMDAIVSLAYTGGGGTKGATLFTYTFPCHNCARHIVAAGIKTVYFLEPYEKSLAIRLHGDAINVDGQPGGVPDGHNSESVAFIHFEGVAPRQYLNMFTPAGERKSSDNGIAVKINVRTAEKKVAEYLDDYREYELKVVEHFAGVVDQMAGQGLPTNAVSTIVSTVNRG